MADQTNTSASWFNGNDAVVLRKGTTVLDSSGRSAATRRPSGAPAWPARPTTPCAARPTICAGDPAATDAFDPAAQWDGFAVDTFDGLGAHTSECGTEPPVDEAPTVVSGHPGQRRHRAGRR